MITKEELITASKTFRKEADNLLQRMKQHKHALMTAGNGNCPCDDKGEVITQHVLSIQDLESCIMRQGMALKYIGNPDPYPDSKDPSNTIVNPTADGLKM